MLANIQKYVSEEEIKRRVASLGAQISKDYEGQAVTIVAVMTGSFIFCADLLRHITCPVRFEFISVSSVRGMNPNERDVKMNLDLNREINGENVILIEDIVETGHTVNKLLDMFAKRNPKTLKLCAFLYKPGHDKHKFPIDYLGFEIEDKYVVGYGLDHDGYFRQLPFIGVYDED